MRSEHDFMEAVRRELATQTQAWQQIQQTLASLPADVQLAIPRSAFEELDSAFESRPHGAVLPIYGTRG